MNTNIDPDTINFNALRQVRRDLDLEILALKKELRSPWGDKDMSSSQQQLTRLKVQSTSFCILRAYLRGRWHLKDEVRCREEAQRLLPQFLRQSQTAGWSGVQTPSTQDR